MDSSTARIERRLLEVQSALAGSMAELLDLVWQLDSADGHPTAYPDAASWLCWSLGVSGRTARQWVRMAHSLRELPRLRSALGAGVISLEQLEVVLKVATPDNEGRLVALATECGSVDELRDEVRRKEDPPEPPDPGPSAPAWLERWWHEDRLHLRGWVAGADGVMVEKALLRLGEIAPRDVGTDLFRDPDVRAGEALVQMASESLAADGDPDRATVVVHVSAVDLVDQRGSGWDAAARLFSTAELERLLCDARIQPAMDDCGGVTVGVGRTTRKIPAWLRRLVEGRDKGCRFPGCRRKRWLEIHHLLPWSLGGPTNLDNLISLCGFHHRLIHAERWTLVGNPNHEVRFYTKWNTLHTPPARRFPPESTELMLSQIEGYAQYRLEQLDLPESAGVP